MKPDGTIDLRQMQDLFWTLITAPEGVRPAIEDLERRGVLDRRAIDEMFTGDPSLPAVERLDIYANMYFYRLLDALAEDYPKVRAALGPDHFHNLVTDYLLRHPSEHPSMRHLGRHLPSFAAAHPLAGSFPWLADLARLEWTRADLFDAADAAPLSRDALAALPQDRAGEARFALVPAFALVRFDHEVVRFWRELDEAESAHDSGEAPHGGATGNAAREAPEAHSGHAGPAGVVPPVRRRSAARVWRKDFVIHHCSLDEEEAQCLELVRSGESIARVCQRLAAGRGVARATERAGRMIQGWLEDGILAGVTVS